MGRSQWEVAGARGLAWRQGEKEAVTQYAQKKGKLREAAGCDRWPDVQPVRVCIAAPPVHIILIARDLLHSILLHAAPSAHSHTYHSTGALLFTTTSLQQHDRVGCDAPQRGVTVIGQ